MCATFDLVTNAIGERQSFDGGTEQTEVWA
jgi:hypothetical protein